MEQSGKSTIISVRDIFLRSDGEVILNHINLDFKDKNGYNMTYKVDAKESIIKWIHL